jgi:hypothetical protein
MSVKALPLRMMMLLLILFRQSLAADQQKPRLPCGQEAFPAYPEMLNSAAITFWDTANLGRDWTPPECSGWTTDGFSSLVTTTARFRAPAGQAGLLQRIGAISELKDTRYWSTTHQNWQTLILDAYALTGQSAGKRRDDFSSEEIKSGSSFYFEQTDNVTGKAIYRLQVREVSDGRIVFGVENASAIQYLFLTIFHPADLQTVYFLDRETQDTWRYYSLVRTGRNASGLAAGKQASSMNRALALFRRLAGIPTDLEPPAAK